MTSARALVPAPLSHPALGELHWHSEHEIWRGTVAGLRGDIGLVIPDIQAQSADELAVIARHVQQIIDAEEAIKRDAADLLSDEFSADGSERFVAESRIASVDYSWGGESEAGVWIPGGEATGYYDVLAIVDKSATVIGALVP